MANFVWAMNSDGSISQCTAPPEKRGIGRCNHLPDAHQREGESLNEFITRMESKISVYKGEDLSGKMDKDEHEITQEQIEDIANQLDAIAGQKVTEENWVDIYNSLTPEQSRQFAKIGFDAAPEFSIPITDEEYSEAQMENQIYFTSLPTYGIAGKRTSIEQMFHKIGTVPSPGGSIDINNNYKNGLTAEEYFDKQFSARNAGVSKTVSISAPGYAIEENQPLYVERNNEKIKILWKDLTIGDKFVDGSEVTYLAPWTIKKCFKMNAVDKHGDEFDTLIVSEDHMVKIQLSSRYRKSDEICEIIGAEKGHWYCANDIYEEFYNHKMKNVIKFSNGNRLFYIEEIGERKVRCISTDSGQYELNGIIHHNTARLLFYGLSDIEVKEDCGGDHEGGILGCSVPGGLCAKCAAKSGIHYEKGQLIGGTISTAVSEPLQQLCMTQFHSIKHDQIVEIENRD